MANLLKRLFSKQYSNDQVHFLKLVKQLNKERVTDSLKEELRSTYQELSIRDKRDLIIYVCNKIDSYFSFRAVRYMIVCLDDPMVTDLIVYEMRLKGHFLSNIDTLLSTQIDMPDIDRHNLIKKVTSHLEESVQNELIDIDNDRYETINSVYVDLIKHEYL